MAFRDVAIIGLLGGAGYLLWRELGGVSGVSIALPIPLPDATGADIVTTTGDYLSKLLRMEDRKADPLAKNPVSSASGLWQFVKGTWTKLGGAWGSDPTKAFGGLTPSVDEQNAMLTRLTNQNAAGLSNAGITVTDATLYAAHLLGLSTALKVLNAPAGASMTALAGSAAVAENKLPSTVGGFMTWLQGKMG